MSTTSSGSDPLLSLWACMLGPPIIWGVRFGASYVLVPWACRAGAMPLMHALTLAAVAASTALGMLAWRHWRDTARVPHIHAAHSVGRIRFMALFGVLASALFVVVMMAEALASAMLDPCQTAGPLLP